MRRPNFLWFSMVYALTLLYLEKTLIKSCNFSKKSLLTFFVFSMSKKKHGTLNSSICMLILKNVIKILHQAQKVIFC